MRVSFKDVEGKKVFVTGADGLIGNQFVEKLVELGAEVRAMVYYNSWNEIGWLRDTKPEILKAIEVFHGDILDTERVRVGVRDCEYVFHLASLIAIPYSYEASRFCVDTNIVGGLNVLYACPENNKLNREVHVSILEVPGKARTVPKSECHALLGQSPYSDCEIGRAKFAQGSHLAFGLSELTGQPFNMFGQRRTPRAVVPAIASQSVANCLELSPGAPRPPRGLNFVRDTSAGMTAFPLCDKANTLIVNFGSNNERPIGQTAKTIMGIAGGKFEIVSDKKRIGSKKSEVNRLIADNNLIMGLNGCKLVVLFQIVSRLMVDLISKNPILFNAENYAN